MPGLDHRSRGRRLGHHASRPAQLDHEPLTGGGDRRLAGGAAFEDTAEFVGHEDRVKSVDFSPDGRIIASGSWDFTARLWDTATQKELLVLEHSDKVGSVSISSDGGVVATGCEDQSVRLWSTRTGQLLETLPDWWNSIRDQQHPFFNRPDPLWRLSIPPAIPPLALDGDWFIDWGGAQRWLYSNENPEQVRRLVASVGGHATLFRNAPENVEVFHPLPAPLLKLQQRIKQAMDPAGILNPGRLYPEL